MNDVQSNMFLSTLKKQKGNSTGAADAASPTPLKEFLQPEQTKKPEQPGRRYETIEEWCARTGMERLPGESDEDMKRRWITRSLTA